jgi:hypothetical protein
MRSNSPRTAGVPARALIVTLSFLILCMASTAAGATTASPADRAFSSACSQPMLALSNGCALCQLPDRSASTEPTMQRSGPLLAANPVPYILGIAVVVAGLFFLPHPSRVGLVDVH